MYSVRPWGPDRRDCYGRGPDPHHQRPNGLFRHCCQPQETLLFLPSLRAPLDRPPHPVSEHRSFVSWNASFVVVGVEIVLPPVDLICWRELFSLCIPQYIAQHSCVSEINLTISAGSPPSRGRRCGGLRFPRRSRRGSVYEQFRQSRHRL